MSRWLKRLSGAFALQKTWHLHNYSNTWGPHIAADENHIQKRRRQLSHVRAHPSQGCICSSPPPLVCLSAIIKQTGHKQRTRSHRAWSMTTHRHRISGFIPSQLTQIGAREGESLRERGLHRPRLFAHGCADMTRKPALRENAEAPMMDRGV